MQVNIKFRNNDAPGIQYLSFDRTDYPNLENEIQSFNDKKQVLLELTVGDKNIYINEWLRQHRRNRRSMFMILWIVAGVIAILVSTNSKVNSNGIFLLIALIGIPIYAFVSIVYKKLTGYDE